MSEMPVPTERELQVLKILWDRGPSTVRDVYEEMRLTETMGQATVQTFLRLMTDKGLVSYQTRGRSFVYSPLYTRKKKMAQFLDQVFDGAVDQLLANALAVKKLSDDEMQGLEKMIQEARRKQKERRIVTAAFDIWVVNSALGVTATLLAGCAAMRFCRQPAARKVVGAWTMVGCLVVGAMAALPGVPRVELGMVPASGAESEIDIGMFSSDASTGRDSAAGSAVARPPRRTVESARVPASTTVAHWALRIYVAIAIFMALRLICGMWLVQRLVRRAQVPNSRIAARWQALGGQGQLLISDALPRPVTAGVIRPVVLVPRFLGEAGREEELDAVLLHELAHVEGRDTRLLWLASILRVFLFAHPLFWWLWRDLRLSQELLADAWAAERIGNAASYAERLVQLSKRSRPMTAWVLPVLQAIRRRSEFYQRMQYLLQSAHVTRPRAARGVTLTAAIALLLVAVAGATLTLHGSARPPAAAAGGIMTGAEERGLKYLAAAQEASGGWLTETGPGVTALTVRALLQGGYAADSPEVRHGLAYIASTRRADGGYYVAHQPSYNTAIVIAALAKFPGNPYAQEVEAGRQFLLSLQKPAFKPGTFYAPAPVRDRFSTEQLVEADALSEALGAGKGGALLSALQAVPERTDDNVVSANGSLTYIQLKSLLYAGLTREDPRVRALVRTVQANFTLETNPLYDNAQGQFYFYYVASKAFRAYGDDRITDAGGVAHAWRGELVNRLAAQQAENGSWINRSSTNWLENNPVLVTTYSVLALQEARR